MRIGLNVPQLGEHVTRESFRRFCESAEALGYDSLWVQEHLFLPVTDSGYAGVPGAPVHPAYASVLAATEAMAFAAAWTRDVTIGSSVLVGGYHRPVELAQRIATLDVLSGGRLIVGLSVGWSDAEHEQMDVDPRTRGRRMDELVQALRACWGPDPVSFEGEFFRVPRSVVRPKPLQGDRLRLMSGMWSPPGLRRTVTMFDDWNPAKGTAEELTAQLADLNAQRAPGQDPLRLVMRSFPRRPSEPADVPTGGLPRVLEDVRLAAAAGVHEMIIDCSFWEEMDGPQAWADLPERLLPVLDVAAGSRDTDPAEGTGSR